MTGSPDLDLVVVGAGPTGLALALQAADHGARVRVVERRPGVFRPSRALIVHPRTLEVLRPLGVTGALLERGDTAPAACLHLRSGVVRARVDALDLPDTPFPHLLLIRQADVEAVLADALADRGVVVERGTTVTGTRIEEDGVCTTFAAGAETGLTSRFVAGCDGADSVVRASMDTAWRGGAYRHEVVLADVELAGDLDRAALHAAPARRGLVFLFALGERATWRLLATRRATAGATRCSGTRSPVPDHDVSDLMAGSGLPAAVTEVRWSARVPLEHRLAGAYRRGPLFLAGDAAHTHSPAGGQGMNTGIQDAANLGWKLAFAARAGIDPGDRAPLLDSYELERRPVARQVLALTHAVFWAEAGTDPVATAARAVVSLTGAAVLPHLLRRRRVVAAGARILGQLNVGYRRSPLSCNGPRAARGVPRAGDRLGDAIVATPEGPARLHDLLAHPGIDLIVERDATVQPTVPPLARVHRLVDRPGTAVAAVRPDGYVGFSGDTTEGAALASWLGLVHLPRAGSP